MNHSIYYTYILECSDNSYYTGVTSELEQRLFQHENGSFPDCYTFKRRPVRLVYKESFYWIDNAIKREKQIKGWTRAKKEALIAGDMNTLTRLSNGEDPSTGSA